MSRIEVVGVISLIWFFKGHCEIHGDENSRMLVGGISSSKKFIFNSSIRTLFGYDVLLCYAIVSRITFGSLSIYPKLLKLNNIIRSINLHVARVLRRLLNDWSGEYCDPVGSMPDFLFFLLPWPICRLTSVTGAPATLIERFIWVIVFIQSLHTSSNYILVVLYL